MMIDSITSTIDRALDYLERCQLPSGQLPLEYKVRDGVPPRVGAPGVHSEQSPFSTAQTVIALQSINDSRLESLFRKALDFLEGQQTRGGLWRFWCRSAPLYDQIPPDVDDTACISHALRIGGRLVPDNEELLLANRRPDGLFYTWMTLRAERVSSMEWWKAMLADATYGRLIGFWKAGARRHHVDATVNANVVAYLGRRPETEAALRWLRSVAASGHEATADRSYRSAAAFYYAVSRCEGTAPGEILDLRDMIARSFGLENGGAALLSMNVLERAMALSALRKFGMHNEVEDLVAASIVSAQTADGSWPSYPIYYDGRDDPLISWGSSAVTTAFCIEALAGAAQ
jgi:hypothetical protein